MGLSAQSTGNGVAVFSHKIRDKVPLLHTQRATPRVIVLAAMLNSKRRGTLWIDPKHATHGNTRQTFACDGANEADTVLGEAKSVDGWVCWQVFVKIGKHVDRIQEWAKGVSAVVLTGAKHAKALALSSD